MSELQSRRRFLARSLGYGCSLAASPILAPVSFASAPWDGRLVVILLRGALDGLDAVPPVGDPNFEATGRDETYLELANRFGLHPGLEELMPLWLAGQMQVVHAVSTPYRDKRSHFDGQDLLEAGTPSLGSEHGRDGWLNRLLQQVPGIEPEVAYAIGTESGTILNGSAPFIRWTPDSDLALSPQALRLAHFVMQDDPRFAMALGTAFELADADGDPVEMQNSSPDSMMSSMMGDMQDRRGLASVRMATFAASRLVEDARIASFSINGWDTHENQQPILTRRLRGLARTVLALKTGLGPVWSKTTVMVMTEFGRTVRINGTRGTDHGTGGAMMLFGGALRGSDVVADWPGLSEADLYDRRDLMPTRDVRAHAGWVMRDLLGIDTKVIERSVFPGVELGASPRHIA